MYSGQLLCKPVKSIVQGDGGFCRIWVLDFDLPKDEIGVYANSNNALCIGLIHPSISGIWYETRTRMTFNTL